MGHNSRFHCVVVGALLVVSCASEPTVITVGSPDGVLDCDEGKIPRAADASGGADTEQGAVEAALATWLEEGARLANPTEAEVWSAVVGGNEVAIAIPEREGDGGWEASVQECGSPETGPAEIDGSLDCAGSVSWTQQGLLDSETPGEDTSERAIDIALAGYLDRSAAEIVMIDETTGSLVIEDREQMVAFASEAPAGGWVVTTIIGCDEIPA